MYLTKEEEKILNGEYGETVALAMKILVGIGEVFEAERLIRVNSVHISGISYDNIRDEGLNFIKKMTNKIRFKVLTTINPVAFDLENPNKLPVDDITTSKQHEIINSLLSAGAKESFTCTPYLIGNRPPKDSHAAWGESSAVAFLNTVIGAKSNKEGGPSALASAIVGKTPLYGLHLEEERKPCIHFKVDLNVTNSTEYSAIGYCIGLILKKGVPYVSGLNNPSLDEMKSFCAGLAAASNIAMAIVKGVSPSSFKDSPSNLEKVCIEKDNLEEIFQRFCEPLKSVDLVFLGCPHYSLSELEKLLYLTQNKKAKVPVLVSTSRYVYSEARKKGYIDLLEKRGVSVLKDTCAVVAPFSRMKISVVATDSAKAAHYLTLKHNLKVSLLSLEEITKHLFR